MKSTGIVRRIDDLGRIVIPKEIRKNLKIREGESLEIYVKEDNNIILRRHSYISDILKMIEILTKVVSSEIDVEFVVIEKDKIIYTSRAYRTLKKTNVLNIKEGKYNLLKLNENDSIKDYCLVKKISMHGDELGKVVFIGKSLNNNDQIVNIVTKFLSSYSEN